MPCNRGSRRCCTCEAGTAGAGARCEAGGEGGGGGGGDGVSGVVDSSRREGVSVKRRDELAAIAADCMAAFGTGR